MANPVIAFLRDPFNPSGVEVEEVEVGSSPYDWLQRTAPDGFGMAVELFLNGEPLALEEADTWLMENDFVTVVLRPGAGVDWALLFWQTVIAIAVGLVMMLLFPPPKAKSREGAAQQYSLSPGNEMPQLGAPIPVAYGTTLSVPYYAAQPWVQYPVIEYAGTPILQTQHDGNWKVNTMYLGALLVATAGEADVVDLFISDSVISPAAKPPAAVWPPLNWDWGNINWPSTPIGGDSESVPPHANAGDADYVKWRRFLPSEHKQTMGTIEAAVAGKWGRWNENVTTSIEVSDQLLSNTKPIGAFAVCLPGQQVREIHLDVMFPNGLGSISKSTGDDNPERQGISWTIERIGDDGYPVTPATTYTGKVEWNIDTPNTVRRTIRIPVPAGRYRVSCSSTNAPHEETFRVRREIRWTGLKAVMANATQKVYGDTTLLAVWIQASEGVSSGAAGRVKLRLARTISSPVLVGASASSNPADIALDVLTNADYGAGRPAYEIDFPAWTRLHTKWDGLPGFNYVFAEPTTILEAMQRVVQVERARIVPAGPKVSVIDASVQPVRTMLFTGHSIKRDSLRVAWSWHGIDDPEGVQIEYTDPVNGTPMSVIYPNGTEDALTSTYRLLGCTERQQALRYAVHTWRQAKYMRRGLEFETEMDGLIPVVGDRIGVSTELVSRARQTQMISYDATTRNMVLADAIDWPPQPVMMVRDKYGQAIGPFHVQKRNATTAHIPAAVTFDETLLGNPLNEEPPAVVIAQAATVVRDYIVTSTEPRGMYSVVVNAVNYDPRAYVATPSDPTPRQWVVSDKTYPQYVIANEGTALSADNIIPWEP